MRHDSTGGASLGHDGRLPRLVGLTPPTAQPQLLPLPTTATTVVPAGPMSPPGQTLWWNTIRVLVTNMLGFQFGHDWHELAFCISVLETLIAAKTTKSAGSFTALRE